MVWATAGCRATVQAQDACWLVLCSNHVTSVVYDTVILVKSCQVMSWHFQIFQISTLISPLSPSDTLSSRFSHSYLTPVLPLTQSTRHLPALHWFTALQSPLRHLCWYSQF
jgi:hypothetical protein